MINRNETRESKDIVAHKPCDNPLGSSHILWTHALIPFPKDKNGVTL